MTTAPRTWPRRNCASAFAGHNAESPATPTSTRMGRYVFERTKAPFDRQDAATDSTATSMPRRIRHFPWFLADFGAMVSPGHDVRWPSVRTRHRADTADGLHLAATHPQKGEGSMLYTL